MGGGLLIFYVANVANVANVRPSKSPKIHPKNQRFFGDPGKGDFVFPPFKGGAGRVLSFLGVLAQQTAKKCSTFAAKFQNPSVHPRLLKNTPSRNYW